MKIAIKKIIKERDGLLSQLAHLRGMLAGIDRAIEIVEQEPDEPEWTVDEAGNPTRVIRS